jgi:hypothetical protein
MYLIDANVVSESRKRGRANSGVIDFLERRRLPGRRYISRRFLWANYDAASKSFKSPRSP